MIDLIQRHLQAIYDVEAPDVRDFLVDAEAVEALTGGGRVAREWVLVRQADEEVDIGVYIHDDDLRAVAACTPGHAVATELTAFCNVTEGVSHFLLLFRRAARDETVSLLELEMQAEVDKYVTASLHGGAGPSLRRRLFRDARLAPGLDGVERDRYAEAGRLAERYCARLERLPDVDRLLGELRRFYRMTGHARLESLRRAA